MDQIYIKVEDLNKWVAKYFSYKDLVTIEDLIAAIEELDGELEHVKEEFEEYKQNVDENYKQILYKDQI